MEIYNCTKNDFDQILTEISEFWGNDRTLHLHHPIFIYEFGNSAYVIREGEKVVAYLFGFLSQTEPAGYVQLIGVRHTNRRQHLGQKLYEHFIEFARKNGCTKIKAITTPNNLVSLAFHKSIGMKPVGGKNADVTPFVRDYSGPGMDRVVLEKIL
jgi:GNAT superfamily N-acetyltransferase